jgi:hypothetical protein
MVDYVTRAQFEDMMARVAAYLTRFQTKPKIIYIDSKRVDSVDWATYEDMFKRWVAFRNKNNVWPTRVYFKPPPVVRTVGPIQSKLEAFLGRFNSFTEYYNKIKGRGYGYYYNDVKTRDETIEALKNKSGINCTDITQLSGDLAREMGYKVRYVRVQCTSGGHIRMQIYGKEFKEWTRVDPAAALSTGSLYDIGRVWCDNNTAKIIDEVWLNIDNGKMV